MIDGNNTSPDWQRHTGDVILLPVGSMEQHAAHLPVSTDSIQAEAQRFRIMVILNGHGGNFALGPVVRYINRRTVQSPWLSPPIFVIRVREYNAISAICINMKRGKIGRCYGPFCRTLLLRHPVIRETIRSIRKWPLN